MPAFTLCLLFCLYSSFSLASIAPVERVFTITLSNGQQLQVIPKGNRVHHWVETEQEEKLVKHQGYWFYARENEQGEVVATDRPVVEGVTLPPVVLNQEAQSRQLQSSHHVQQPQRTPYRYNWRDQSFQQPMLVVRVAFADQGFEYGDADIAERIFGYQNSVRDYYLENSYQRFDIQPVNELDGTAHDGIVRVTLPINHPNSGAAFGDSVEEMIKKVLVRLPDSLNLSSYDRNGDQWLDPNELAMVFMIAGYEQAYAGAASSSPSIWAHKASLYQAQTQGMNIGEYALFGEQHQNHQATIGIICHELGHLLFDLPDLYDRKQKSAGVGRWGLMGLGGWNTSQGFAGNRPAHMLAWSKEQAGFLQPRQLPDKQAHLELRAVTDAADAVEIPLDTYRHGQRLLMEHRRLQEYDQGLPGEGVLVTHINDWVGYGPMGQQNDDVNNKLVGVQEADGQADLDVNRNRGDSTDVFQSATGAKLYSAQRSGQHTGAGSVELMKAEVGLVAGVDIRVANTVKGDNVGLDDVGPNETWGEHRGSAQVMMALPIANKVQWLDGIDWFALGDGVIDISLLLAPPDSATDSDYLLSEKGLQVSHGWNRLMFPQRIANAGYQYIYLLIGSRALGDHAPLVTDIQGNASGQTQVRETTADDFDIAPFDVAARLLVMNDNSPVAQAEPIKRTSLSTNLSPSSSNNSGGAMSWLLLFLVPAYRRV